MKIQVLHTFKSQIAEIGVLMTVCYALFDTLKVKAGRNLLAGVMVALAVLSCAAYFDFGHYAQIPFYINRHDIFHYYMGAKYSPEIGSLYLYPSCVIVDEENGKLYKTSTIRNQNTYDFEPASEVRKEPERYKALFSDKRWKEFEKDALFFRKLMGEKRWQRALRDKGYNATPTWNMVAYIITNNVKVGVDADAPADTDLGIRFLIMLDVSLIVIMFCVVWWAFGWRTTLFAIIFFGTNFMMNETHIKGSLLRLDWVTLMTMSVCMLKKGHYKTAGAMMGYAAMSRLFPAIFLFGIGVKFLLDFVSFSVLQFSGFFKTHKRDLTYFDLFVTFAVKFLLDFFNTQKLRKYFELFVTFAVVVTLLVTLSVIGDGGFEVRSTAGEPMGGWKVYLKLIEMHNDDVVEVRTGFKYVFLNTYTNTLNHYGKFRALKNKQFHDNQAAWWTIQVLMLLATAYFVRKFEDYEALCCGFVPFFFLVAPTFYYYVLLVVPLLLFAPKLKEMPRAVGLAMMFAFSIVGYMIRRHTGLNFSLFFWNSVMYMILAGYILYAGHLAQPVLAGASSKGRAAQPEKSMQPDIPELQVEPGSAKRSRPKKSKRQRSQGRG